MSSVNTELRHGLATRPYRCMYPEMSNPISSLFIIETCINFFSLITIRFDAIPHILLYRGKVWRCLKHSSVKSIVFLPDIFWIHVGTDFIQKIRSKHIDLFGTDFLGQETDVKISVHTESFCILMHW